MYDAQLDLSDAHSDLGKKNFIKAAQCEEQSFQIKTSRFSYFF